jgi:hypothetical protein
MPRRQTIGCYFWNDDGSAQTFPETLVQGKRNDDDRAEGAPKNDLRYRSTIAFRYFTCHKMKPTSITQLIILTSGNPENQEYFGDRRSPQGVHFFAEKGVHFFAEMMSQLEDPLGPAVTLSKLLSANENLMKKYAKADLVKRFLDMVRFFGPQAVRKRAQDT